MVKPFAFAELLARLRALARRGDRRAARSAHGRRLAARSGNSRGRPRGRHRSCCQQRSLRCWRRSCDGRARCCPGFTYSSTPGTSPTRTARTWSTSICAGCGAKSTSRSVASRWRRYAASATGCAARTPMSRLPIRLRVDGGIRARHGRRSRRLRPLPVSAAWVAPRCFPRPRPAAARSRSHGARQPAPSCPWAGQQRPLRRAWRELRAAARTGRACSRRDAAARQKIASLPYGAATGRAWADLRRRAGCTWPE